MGVRIGVIGAGLMGSTHVRLLSGSVPGGEVAAIADAIGAAAERLAAEAGVDAVYTDALELIHDPAVDAVIVASPAQTHEAFVLACLEAGKPVLCEKPLAADAEAARRVLEAESSLGRRLVQVGFMRRFDPGYVELKARLDGGEIGVPLLLHSAHRNPAVPPTFGTEMILHDTVVHDIDTARWLLGQEIAEVTVVAGAPSPRAAEGVLDPLLVLLRTDAGAMITVEAFVNAQYGYDIRCEIVGETGAIALPLHGSDVPPGFQERFRSAYVNELRSWTAAIAGGGEAGAGAWDGVAAAAVCEAAVESLHSGRPATPATQEGLLR